MLVVFSKSYGRCGSVCKVVLAIDYSIFVNKENNRFCNNNCLIILGMESVFNKFFFQMRCHLWSQNLCVSIGLRIDKLLLYKPLLVLIKGRDKFPQVSIRALVRVA